MGEAKRRKALDPTFGQPRPYVAQIHDGDGTLDAEIPFTIVRKATVDATHKKAIANAIAIMGYLINQDDKHYRLVAQALGDESAEALRAYAADGLPEKFWCSILAPNGAQLVSPEGGLIALASARDVTVPGKLAGDWNYYQAEEVIDRAIA